MNSSTTIPTRILPAAIAAVLISILATGCGGNSTDPDPPEFNIQTTATQSHGEVLADQNGEVLYFFTPDIKGESKCQGQCIENWPTFHVDELNPAQGLDAADFGSIARPDAGNQTTYRGWPLYYFVGDEQPGDVNGDGVNGVWFAAKTGYSLMLATEQLVGADGKNYVVDANGDYVVGEGSTTYFTDAEGRTLYIFAAQDSTNTNNCTSDGCMGAWPVFHTAIESLPSAMNPGDFGEFTAHGDRQQLTYKGWPVYYFAQDAARGETKGVSVPQPGAWPILRTDMAAAPGYETGSAENPDPGYTAGSDDPGSGY